MHTDFKTFSTEVMESSIPTWVGLWSFLMWNAASNRKNSLSVSCPFFTTKSPMLGKYPCVNLVASFHLGLVSTFYHCFSSFLGDYCNFWIQISINNLKNSRKPTIQNITNNCKAGRIWKWQKITYTELFLKSFYWIYNDLFFSIW